MKSILHIPALRGGKTYESLDQGEVKDFRTGEVRGKVSQVNAGAVRKDLQRLGLARTALKKFTTSQLIEICAGAGEAFLSGSLPLGTGGRTQDAGEYVETLSATSGLPQVMVRRNMAKIHHALTNMGSILNGLTRGLDPAILDHGA
jgi:hypothetical protein